MKRELVFKITIAIAIAIGMVTSIALLGCATTKTINPPELINEQATKNFIDERNELVSLIFRLAGRGGHLDLITDYQKELYAHFLKYKDHPAVLYTVENLIFGFDAICGLAVHLSKVNGRFELIENLEFIYGPTGWDRWTPENTAEFIPLLNSFYIDTKFADFLKANHDYFQTLNEEFYDQIYGNFNFEWFSNHGVNPDNMRIILSPSSSTNGYGGWILGGTPQDNIIYACLPLPDDGEHDLGIIIHEFAHAIGNPLARIWYEENIEFRRWSDETIDLEKMPHYPHGLTIAGEYLTRAYTILYIDENFDMGTSWLFDLEISQGFKYIREVFELVKIYISLNH